MVQGGIRTLGGKAGVQQPNQLSGPGCTLINIFHFPSDYCRRHREIKALSDTEDYHRSQDGDPIRPA